MTSFITSGICQLAATADDGDRLDPGNLDDTVGVVGANQIIVIQQADAGDAVYRRGQGGRALIAAVFARSSPCSINCAADEKKRGGISKIATMPVPVITLLPLLECVEQAATLRYGQAATGCLQVRN